MSNNTTVYLTPCITAIMQRFKPTADVGLATHCLSTKEITDAINELNPECNASLKDTYDALTQAGFTFTSPPGSVGIQFKWLMIEK